MPERSPAPRRAWAVAAVGAAIVLLLVIVGLTWPEGDDRPRRRTLGTLAISGWVAYWQVDAGLASFTEHRQMFEDVSIMAYAARGVDSVVPFEGLASYAIDDLRASASAAGVATLATIFDEMPEGGMAAVLADPATRTRHVAAILTVVDERGFDGVDLDYEQFAFADDRSTWAETRPNWIAFLTELAAGLHARGDLLVVTVPPIYDDGTSSDTGAWVYDYASMAQIVDRIRVMAYDYSVGQPGPIAPIEWVRSLVEAIIEVAPSSKIDLGIPVYGRDWPVSVEGTCPLDQEPKARAVSTRGAHDLAAGRGLVARRDEVTEEVRLDYTDVLTGTDAAGAATSCTVQRTVRYLDAGSIQARAQIAWQYDLHGVVLWSLGNDDPPVWAGLADAVLGLRPGETLPPTTLPPAPTPT